MEFLKTLMQKPAVQYLLRLFQNIEEDYIGLLAAGVAFYFFMAAFPALAALISLYGIFSDPVFISQQLQNLENFMPPESLKILADQAQSISSSSGAALGLGFIVGLILAVYATTKGVRALMKGLNIAYNTRETRNMVVQNYTAFMLTFGLMVYLLFSLSLIALMPALFNILPLPGYVATTLLMLRWPLLMLSALIGLQIIYHYGPCRPKNKKIAWYSWGSIVAMLFWVGGSSLFSLFVSNFGNYNETYGSLGAVAVLLLWFWLNALTILLGAEVNASFQSEEQRGKKPAHLSI